VAVASLVVYTSEDLSLRGKLFPWVIGIPIILTGLFHTIQGLFPSAKRRRPAAQTDAPAGSPGDRLEDIIRALFWVVLLLAGVLLIGHEIAVPLFILTYLLARGEKIWLGITMAAATGTFIHVILGKTMNITFPEPILFRWLGF
jgi:hypothetical protein